MSLLGSHHLGRQAMTLLLGIALTIAGLVAVATSARAADPCGTGGNAIACENSKPGSPPSEWDIVDAGDDSIQGFSTDISVNAGSKIDFKIDTNASAYSITIYRMGYYGGDGARQIATVTPSARLPQTQPNCIWDATTELTDCGNWAVSASWNVPSTAVSGVYIALLKRNDNGDRSHITFVVRNDSSHSDVVFQTSDTTWQAYNTYGGSDFYQGGANGRAYKVSYNRPVLTRGGIGGRDFFMSNEYPMVRFLERNGYDVTYLSGVDSDRYGTLLKNHKVFLSVGHDEYWSGAQRANVEAARDAGVNLQFLSGNEVYWRTRYEPSVDPSHTAYRTLVSYKETWGGAKIDPATEWTGTWRDPRFAPKSAGAGRPENGLTGTMYMSNFSDLPITVSAAEGKLRLWRNTSLASMSSGSAALAPHTVGYESNEDVDNGDRPAGLIRLSTTTGAVPEYLQDFGNTTAPGTTTHHMTMYKAASGALVFSAGTVQWTWGLDAVHDSAFDPEPADIRMQQAQVNLLADMGAQPTTLMSGLTATAKSTDTAAPTVTITTPSTGATLANGAQTTITGTAADVGGKVAGVEVSTDGGATWHPANGTTSWSYTYVQHGVGTLALRARAIDDSANIGTAVTRNTTVTCPCSVLGSATPPVVAVDDSGSAELGLRFTALADGYVTGVRFYKGPGNGGTHIGSLWSSSGQRLAQATFTNETATGWQSVNFASPVAVAAGQTYVASYTNPQGHYSMEQWAFASRGIDADPLQVAGGYGATAGVFSWPGTFPSSTYRASNYFVDVNFSTVDNSPLIAMNQWPLADSSSVPSNTTVGAQLSKPVASGSVGLVLKDPTNQTVPGTVSYDSSTRTVTLTPSAPLNGFVKYTATVSATDNTGNPVTSGKTWSFTTARPANAPGVCPCTLFDDTKVPTMLEANDPGPVTLGVRFTADRNGTVTGVRFYKSINNVGVHTGALWTATGTLLAQGTFTNESTTGWQTLTFASPVSITKDTVYVASYRAPNGRWSADLNVFDGTDLNRAPLHVMASSGAYTYGTGFPGDTSASNYHVDVVFEKGAPTIAVASQDPAANALDVPRGTPIKVSFTSPIASGAQLAVSIGTTAVSGTTALSSDGLQVTFTPSGPLPADSDVTVKLTGVTSVEGASLATQTWSFHTRSNETTDAQTLFGDVVPVNPAAASDGAPVELGTRFTPNKSGKVTAIRFYKGLGNAGTHTGSLWTSTGQRLAAVTFTNETATGWQSATLASPVPVTAGTTYVVSYYAPQGHYAFTSGFFDTAWTHGSLTAPAANNGRYLYGSGGGFPTDSWAGSNYFVDVLFVQDPPSITVASRNPAANATGVPRAATPSVTFSDALASGWSMTVKQGTTTIAGSAAASSDAKTLVFTPSAPLPSDADITVTVSGITSTEGATLGTQTWGFHTQASGVSATASLFVGQTPVNDSVSDGSPLELGVAFTPSVNGQVTKIRFYKGAGNTGTHTGSIWSSSGTRLATVTFTNETATGWQEATLATPLDVTAGQTYIASYFAPTGVFSVSPGFFSAPTTVGPLTAPAANGRFTYSTGNSFPDITSGSGNSYLVDVVFQYLTP